MSGEQTVPIFVLTIFFPVGEVVRFRLEPAYGKEEEFPKKQKKTKKW